jgi:hypothetical protein
MPCTRPAHCGAASSCDAKLQCQKKGAVWKNKAEKEKEKDNNGRESGCCKDDDDCNPGEQCGYSLFNLDDRSGKNLVAKIERGARKKQRRGVCQDPVSKFPTCSNAANGKDCAAGVECVGYRLEALGKEE